VSLPQGDLWSLLDWRRRVLELYRRVRASDDPEEAWFMWRRERDEIFGRHPQSPIPASTRPGWTGLYYYDYDPAARVLAQVGSTRPEAFDIPTSGDETMSFTQFATARFSLAGSELSLGVYWLHGYGGGVFVPFRDATSGAETYGAGRYLLDTIKGADLGTEEGRLVLDFNFAYNPSCAYDPRWVCPLAPPPNRLALPVRAGERIPH
jgi:uncharacterized protein (DUF1684 family)